MRGFWRDFLVSLRMFRHSPGLAAGVAVTIGLGVGGSLAIFGLLHGGLIPPSPFRESSALVIVANTGRYYMQGRMAEGHESDQLSMPDYRDIEAQTRTLAGMGTIATFSSVMTGGDRPRHVRRSFVTPNLLPLLAPRPRLGRLLDAGDFKPAAAPAALITESMWRKRFDGDRAIIGRHLRLDERPFTIVGVLPDAALRYLQKPGGLLEEPRDEAVVTPRNPETAGSEGFMLTYTDRQRDWPSLATTVARLAPGRSLADAQSEMQVIGRRLAAAHPEANKGRGVVVQALDEWRTSAARGTVNMLLAAAVLVFLVASANAAGLILADGVRHETETAVRQALGAAPSRLVVTELTRGVVLALPGGVLAVLMAAATLGVVDRTVAGGTGAIARTLLIPRVAAAGLLYTLVAGLVCGAAAAWSVRRRNVAETLKEGGLTASSGRHRQLAMRAFVAVQVAAATALVLGAGLMLRSVWNILAVDLGFEVRHGLVAEVRLPASRYPKGPDQRAFLEAALQRVRAIPGVAGAGVAVAPPLSNASQVMSGVEMETPRGVVAPERLNYRSVTPGYLESLEMRLVRGRWFTASDGPSESSAAMVDQAFCRKYLAGMDPLAVKLRVGKAVTPIVGIVGDTRDSGPLAEAEPTLYLIETFDRPARFAYIVVRAQGNPSMLSAQVLREVLAGDPNVSVEDPVPVSKLLANTYTTRRRMLALLVAASATVLLLTAFSLVSALTQFVAGRRRDIAIRLALGADRRHIAGMLTRHVAVAIVVGLVVGATAGLALARTLSAQLFGLEPADPGNVAATLAVLAALSAAAAAVPVWRASRINPTTTLRAQ